MLVRIGGRLLAAMISVVAAVVLCFALGQLTPGDAFTALEMDPAVAPAEVAHLRAEYLPQQSLPRRLAAWAAAAVHGDLGVSLETHRPVLSLLRQRIPASAELLALGLGGAWGIGLGLALLPAWLGELGGERARHWLGSSLHAGASLLTSLPLGVLAIAALVWAPVSWLPQPGGGTPWLPALVLGLAFLPTVYFQAAQALAEVAQRGFLQQGRALGFSASRLWLRHALPNTSDVLVPVASLTLSQALIELVVLEPLLGWPGVGQLSLQASQSKDMPVLAALVLLTSLVVILANLASEMLQPWWNPQLRRARRMAAAGGAL